MNRISVSVLTLAISAAAAFATSASAQNYGNGYGQPTHELHSAWARVVRIESNAYGGGYDQGGSAYDGGYEREECWNEQTNAYDPGYYRDSSGRLYRGERKANVQGAVIGAIVGGALGNTVGKGDGRKAATIAGAVIGGTVGAHTGNDRPEYEYRDDSGVVTRCRTVVDYGNNPGYGNGYDNHEIRGYNVTYSYAGQNYHAFMRDRPGRYIRVTIDVQPQEVRRY